MCSNVSSYINNYSVSTLSVLQGRSSPGGHHYTFPLLYPTNVWNIGSLQ